MKVMKIGEIARRSGVGIETIRYYEREGLLQKPERRPSGYRQYNDSIFQRLDYIRSAKELGFTLSEIRELLELSFAEEICCDSIREHAQAKLADIENRICSLHAMKKSLQEILKQCASHGHAENCPLVHKSLTDLTQHCSLPSAKD